MTRPRIVAVLLLALAPRIASAQSLSLTAGNASGDCAGTSFYQAADASGKFIGAGWAVASEFPVAINRGFVRCVMKMTVTVQTGYKLVPGTAAGAATRLAIAQFSPLRLNGASSHVLVETAVSVDNGTPATASGASDGGPMTGAMLALDRAATAPVVESACSNASKSTFVLTAQLDAAVASNYASPWPPEPYAERENASLGSVKLFYNVVPCSTRTAVPQRPGA